MKKLSIIISLLAFSFVSYSQELCEDCPCLLEQGDIKAAKGDNPGAISLYQAYVVCDPTKVSEVTEKIKKIQEKTESEKKLAQQAEVRANTSAREAKIQKALADQERDKSRKERDRSRKLARANHNLAVTRRTLEQNPTMALRMAESSLRDYPDNDGILQAYADIFSDASNFFYQRKSFTGHKGNITALSLSPDGQLILSAGSDGTVRLWNNDGNTLKIFDTLPGNAAFVEFSNNGEKILFGNAGWAWVGNINGEILARIQRPNKNGTKAVVFSPDDNSWAWGDEDGCITLWKCSDKLADSLFIDSICTNIGYTNKVYFSPKGDHLLACGDNSAIIWNILKQKNKSVPLSGRQGSVLKGAFSKDGKELITMSDTTARLWNLKGDSLNTISYYYKADDSYKAAEFDKITFMENDTLLLEFKDIPPILFNVSKPITEARTFNAADRKDLEFETKSRGKWLLIFSKPESPDGGDKFLNLTLYSTEGKYRGRIFIPDRNDWPELVEVTREQEIMLYFKYGDSFQNYTFSKLKPTVFRAGKRSNERSTGKTNSPYVEKPYAAFSPDSKTFGYHLPGDEAATIHKVTDGPRSTPLRPQKKDCTTKSIAMNPDAGNRGYMLMLNSDGTASLLDTTAREFWSTLNTGDSVLLAKFSAGGKEIFILDASFTIWRWRVDKNERLRIGASPEMPKCMAVSPDGSLVATSTGTRQIYFWRLRNDKSWEQVIFQELDENVEDIVFAPDNQNVMIRNSRGEISVWNVNSPDKPLNIWRGYAKEKTDATTTGWKNAILSPKGDRILLIGDEHSVLLTNLDGSWTTNLQGQDYPVKSAAFSADESYILTSDAGNVMRLWNEHGKMVAKFTQTYEDKLLTAAISPDGTHVLGVDGNGDAYLWKTPKEFLKNGIQPFSFNELAGSDLLPDPDSLKIDAGMQTDVLLKTAYNFLGQGDTTTAHKLFDYLLTKVGDQGVEVWYNWYITIEPARRDLDTFLKTMIKNDQEVYPIAWRFKRDQFYPEAKTLYEYIIDKEGKLHYLWDYLEVCRLGNSQPDKKLFLRDTNTKGLNTYGQYFLDKKDLAMARELFRQSLESRTNSSALLGLIKINDLQDRQFVEGKIDSLTEPLELMRIANYYRENGLGDPAAKLYRKVLNISEVPEANIGLYEVSKTGTDKSSIANTMLQSRSSDALRRYADYFGEKNLIDLKINALEKIIAIGEADSYDYFERYHHLKESKGKDTFGELLVLKSPDDIKGLMSYFATEGNNSSGYDAVDYYEKATKLGERLITMEDTPQNRETLSAHYNSLGWRCILIGEFARSGEAINRGIKIDKDYLKLYTNLPHTLLFQGKVDEAKEIYLDNALKKYQPERNRPFFRDVYLADFVDFKRDFNNNPDTKFTAQMIADVNAIEKELKALPPNKAKK